MAQRRVAEDVSFDEHLRELNEMDDAGNVR